MYRILSVHDNPATVYPKKYAHGFVVLCFVVVMQSFIMNSHEVFIHIHQGCFAGTGAIVRLPQCQWSKPDGYGKISQCITTTKHSKAKTVCIYCSCPMIYLCAKVHNDWAALNWAMGNRDFRRVEFTMSFWGISLVTTAHRAKYFMCFKWTFHRNVHWSIEN